MDISNLSTFVNDNIWLMLVLAIWTLPWKGVALWKAVKREDKWWFIAMLILNTVAILEIIYIFFIAKRPKKIAPTF